jgi:hypothetical protein
MKHQLTAQDAELIKFFREYVGLLYASHHFETAVDLTVCVKDHQRPGIYLITPKGSQHAGHAGFKGGIVRKVAVDKSRFSLERAFAAIKQNLESQRD